MSNEDDINFSDVDSALDTIISGMSSAAETSITKRSYKPYLKPYWCAELKTLHDKMRRERQISKTEDKPRGNETSYSNYKESKRQFRRLLRQRQSQFEKDENERIDSLVELDQNGFWKMVNSRRKSKRHTAGLEIKFDEHPVQDPDDMLSGWCGYFTQIYSQTENPNFDDNFKQVVDRKVDSIMSSEDNDNDTTSVFSYQITRSELDEAIKALPLNKAMTILHMSI